MAVRLAREGFHAPHHPIASRDRAADDEDCIVSSHRAEHVGPGLTVEGGGDWLGASRNGAKNEQLPGAIDAKNQLGQQRLQGSTTLLYASVGYAIARAFRRGDPGEPQLPQIPGESCLGYVPSALQQKL